MDSLAGYEWKKYEFSETGSDGFYEQVILRSDLEESAGFHTRYHVTLLD